jgi:hypothetical protein
MKLNFCTLFNTNYLSRGIAMYESLQQHCPDFYLYVYAFDQNCYNYLKELDLKNLTVIPLSEFEDPQLLEIKPTRSAGEYCWTCTPSTILYAIKTYGLDHCTYVDADLLFYSDPAVLIDEMREKTVMITEHRYTPAYDQAATSGKYCVQFVTARNDPDGIKVMEWWRNACIDWCYARAEDGKFGDQKYLDSWTSQFSGVHELQHLGGGLAPWNVQQYTFEKNEKHFTGIEISSGKKFDVIFFHFHGLKFYEDDIVSLTDAGYEIRKEVIDLFYRPYVRILNSIAGRIRKSHPGMNANGVSGKAPYGAMGLSTLVNYYRQGLKSSKRNLSGLHLLKKIKHHYFFKAAKF